MRAPTVQENNWQPGEEDRVRQALPCYMALPCTQWLTVNMPVPWRAQHAATRRQRDSYGWRCAGVSMGAKVEQLS